MSRIEISLPAVFDFSTVIPIRLGDINRGIHVSHIAVLSIMEEARAQFLVILGYVDQVTIKGGLGYIIADVGIIYKSQASYGQTIRVEIAALDFKEKSFDLVYRIINVESGVEIARAKTGILFFDYDKQKIVPIPADFKAKFSKIN